MKKILFFLFLTIHFSAIIYNNLIASEESVHRCKYQSTADCKTRAALDNIPGLTNFYTFYSRYTGTETGYGFYGPNVSNPVVLVFTKMDRNGNVISIESPRFSSYDANIRYYAALDMFLKKLYIQDGIQKKYLNTILKSMAMWELDKDNRCTKVLADLMIYDMPSIPNKNDKPTYIKLGHYEYAVKNLIAKN